MGNLTIKLGNVVCDLGDSKLSVVLSSPYPLMAAGLQGGNFVFNFSLPASPELKKEFKHAHRPQAKPMAAEIPFQINAAGLIFSGIAELTEADDETYEVFCPVGNGDFNTRAKSISLNELDLGGSAGVNDTIQIEAASSQAYFFGDNQPAYFFIEQAIFFDVLSVNLEAELNSSGTAITASAEKHINLTFSINGQYTDTISFFIVYKNGSIIKTFGLQDGEQSLKIINLAVNQGDVITWKLRFEAFSLDGIVFTIMADVFAGAQITSSLSQANTIIREAAINRYPVVNFAVFPLENPFVFDKWPDDYFQIDNENIKVVYSEIFKVINYWKDDEFPIELSRNVEGVEYTAGNLFLPFPYIAFIIKQIAFRFNYRIINNIFEDELKYAVLINHFIENRFINDDPKKLVANPDFDLSDHVPDWTIYRFLQELGNLFGFGYEVDNNLNTIEFQFVEELHKNAEAIDISHLLVKKPVVQFDKQIKAYSLEQKTPSEDKYFDQVKPMDGLNYLGVVDLLGDLPLNSEINDCYFVKFMDAYVIWHYDSNAYVFGWVFHSRKFVGEIKSGGDPQRISSELCPLLSRTVYDPLGDNDRVWTIPASYQAANFESAPDAFKASWKPGIVWYHGLLNDTNGEQYPYASAGTTDPSGNQITGTNLALTLDGQKGLFEKKWKSYLNWRISAKPVKAHIIPDQAFLHNFRFKTKLRFGGVNYKVCEARGNISQHGPDVWELLLLVD